MNLWVKRTGQLASLAVALFFFSCQDQVSFNGFPNPNPKFNIKYIEIPLQSSVFLTDSVRTVNVNGESYRVLAGNYDDPGFGHVRTLGYSQLVRFSTQIHKDTVTHYDSAVIELRFDYYSYGLGGTTDEIFSAYRIGQKLLLDSVGRYFSNRATPYSTLLGRDTVKISESYFKEQYFNKTNEEKDTTVLKIVIDDSEFGRAILQAAQTDDWYDFSKLSGLIEGIAIVPGDNNKKIVGFDLNNTLDPQSLLSGVKVFYHTDNAPTKKKTLNMTFGGIGYTKIETDRSASPDLSQLLENTPEYFLQETTPPVKRYIQQGTGITTKFDLSNFYSFTDTVENLIINSAEIAVTDIDNYDLYYPIPQMALVVMSTEHPNQYKKPKYKYVPTTILDTTIYTKALSDADVAEISSYKGLLNNYNGVYTAISDAGSPVVFSRSGGTYNTYITLLAQHLATRSPTDRYSEFAFFPSSPQNPQSEKSVNRIIFNKDNLKLRIYYTTPIRQETH